MGCPFGLGAGIQARNDRAQSAQPFDVMPDCCTLLNRDQQQVELTENVAVAASDGITELRFCRTPDDANAA
jgi:hypothetical protein